MKKTDTPLLDSQNNSEELLEAPKITVFTDRDFKGARRTFSQAALALGSDWNDKISSFIIERGTFEFYGAANYQSEDWGPVRLSVGQYPWVEAVGIRNDTISSWRAFSGDPGPGPVPPLPPPVPLPIPHPTPPAPTPTPPPTPPPTPTPPLPPVIPAKDYLDVIRNNPPQNIVCTAGFDRIINKHPTKAIEVWYTLNNNPQQYTVSPLPPNGYYQVGCSTGAVYHWLDSTHFL
ncbi:hypothetical protein GCM10028803_07900 [Larkinella knui]|uniref:Beta/gamma crystallin 'Greek key' domain-containing protein n=1 Tax=Larkinella knui TaxID=2025310 RepID=A0A3P1CJL7_9BACT|nr:beta/gamma crystallin-related protein [Larkinella knui]RRB13542.1 hypothetical protein EHT87_14845 [Larkinella knui]